MEKQKLPDAPLPEPFRGCVEGSFAHTTVTQRFLKILGELSADNEFPPMIKTKLAALQGEIPDFPLKPIEESLAPDVQDWNAYLKPYSGCSWLQVPWFLAEMYFYRRILDEIGYYQPGEFQGYDPFINQKQRILRSASSTTSALGEQLGGSSLAGMNGEKARRADFQQLAVLNVWGNQADLSMWSASEDRPDHRGSTQQRSHLLADDTGLLFDAITDQPRNLDRVDFILDNFGPELIIDIGLADYLLHTKLASRVRLHAKPHPHYVSDAMIKDVHSTIDYLAEFPDESIQRLSERVRGYIDIGKLEIKADYFWTSPLAFWEMPKHIRDELSASNLVISKGDANYRRLCGDLDWPPTTPFQKVVAYFPVPLFAMRVLKSELALGLKLEKVHDLDYQDPEWRINGNWAVIQFFPG